MKTKILLTSFLLISFSLLYAQDISKVYIYNGPGNQVDQARDIYVDLLRNVYVTGNSKGSNSSDDFATIKYDFHGTQKWVARYNSTGNNTDIAYALTVDDAGNVYVTGWGYTEPGDLCGSPDYITIKYNSNGVQQWVKKYNGPGGGDDFAYAIAIDRLGNVYVTGESAGNSTGRDYATIKYNNSGVQQWVARYDGVSHGLDVARKIAVDYFGNVYVTGNSYKSGSGADYITVKYNTSGQLQWAARYNGPGNGDDIAYDIEYDVGTLSVFVTGSSKGSSSLLDYATVRYDVYSGLEVWLARYNGPANNNDEGMGVAVDAYSYVYVTGASVGSGTNYDFATIQYAPNGGQRWVKRFNDATANGIDKAWDIEIAKRPCEEFGDVPCYIFDIYVTGQSRTNSTLNDYVTIDYDSRGREKWIKRFNSSNNTDDIPAAVGKLDGSDYVYVTGIGNNNYTTVLYYYYPDSYGQSGITGNGNLEFSLKQNYPNPFNPVTGISYTIRNDNFVELNVYNTLGEVVSTLVKEYKTRGSYTVSFDAGSLPSGMYFYMIKAGDYVETRKMMLIK